MRVGLCLPSQDSQSDWFGYDLAGLVGKTVLGRPDIELRRFKATGTWLPQVRHYITRAALHAECDYLLWLDSDMRFPPDALLQLLAREQAVVAANYPTRKAPIQPVAVASDGSRIYTELNSTGIQEVAAVGMGLMLVRADLVRSIAPPWFMLGWIPDDQDYSGEDGFFCRKLTEAGATIWIDHDLSQDVRHLGILEFEQEHALHMRRTLQTKESP